MHSLENIHSGKANKFKSLLAITTFLITTSGTLQAGTHYVSPNGTASWSQCTAINAPCSAATAMQNAVAGDTTFFKGGTYSITGDRTPYHGLLEPANSGTSGNPIIFQAYINPATSKPETPIISVNCDPDNSQKYQGNTENQCWAIGTNAKNYITWDGFTLTTSNNKTAGVFIGGQTDSTGAVFKNNTVIAGTLPVPNGDNYDMTRMEQTFNASFINNKVGGLNSLDKNYNATNNSCLKMYFNEGATITNNEIFDCPTGISAKANLINAAIRYNYIHDNHHNMEVQVYTTSAQRNSYGNTFDHNIFSKPGYLNLSIQAGDDATAADWDVHNNTFYAISTPGFLRNLWLGASANLIFYNNIIIGPGGTHFSTITNRSSINSMDHNQYGTSSLLIELRRYDNSSAEYYSLSSWNSSGELIGGGNPGGSSLASDPLFMNNSGNMAQISDFELSGGSPSKNTGRNNADMGAKATLVGSNLLSPPKPPIIVTVIQ